MTGKTLFALFIVFIWLAAGGILIYEWIDYCTLEDCVGGDIGN